MLSDAAKRLIRDTLDDVPHGGRGDAVERLAAMLDKSPATIYRVAGIGGARRPRKATHPERREWVRVVVA